MRKNFYSVFYSPVSMLLLLGLLCTSKNNYYAVLLAAADDGFINLTFPSLVNMLWIPDKRRYAA